MAPARAPAVRYPAAASGVDVRVQLLERRLRALLGKLHRVVDQRASLFAKLRDLVVGDSAGLQQPLLQEPDRVALAPLVDLVFGAVALQEVGGAVGREAVGDRLDGVWLAALAHPFARTRLAQARTASEVHAVDILVLDAVGVEFGGEVGHRGGPLDAGAHAVVVVLDDEEGRVHPLAAPESGQVGRLMEGAVVDRAVAEVELGDAVGALVALRVGHADPERNVAADDAVAAHEAVLDVEQVHRAALAPDQAGALAVQLGHHLARGGAEEDGVGVVAVGGDDAVTFAVLVEEAGGDRFLAAVEVEVAADLAGAEAALGRRPRTGGSRPSCGRSRGGRQRQSRARRPRSLPPPCAFDSDFDFG